MPYELCDCGAIVGHFYRSRNRTFLEQICSALHLHNPLLHLWGPSICREFGVGVKEIEKWHMQRRVWTNFMQDAWQHAVLFVGSHFS